MITDMLSRRLEEVESVFMKFQSFGDQEMLDIDHRINDLELEPPRFRSIAYESYSMGLSSFLLRNHRSFDTWHQFRQSKGNAHYFHIYIGLGWALGKQGILPEEHLPEMSPLERSLCYNGMGYYFALFRGRRTLKNQTFPALLGPADVAGFDEGVGRRLWYHVRGSTDNLIKFINSFDSSRRASLWKGVGIASIYVGGLDREGLEGLQEGSGSFLEVFRNGAMLSILSRIRASCVEQSTKLACEVIYGRDIEQFINVDDKNVLVSKMDFEVPE
jgi:hypothetical protein